MVNHHPTFYLEDGSVILEVRVGYLAWRILSFDQTLGSGIAAIPFGSLVSLAQKSSFKAVENF
jgi:hypothetical protein